jgi:hypothetical protein
MKEGTGGDPFADDASETVDADESADTADPTTDSSSPDQSESAAGAESTPETNADTSATQAAPGGPSEIELPYYYRRETVKEGRDQVPFFLRDHVQDLEDEFIEDLEERLNASNVYKADAREAALQVVYENYAGEVADLLRDWGYDR